MLSSDTTSLANEDNAGSATNSSCDDGNADDELEHGDEVDAGNDNDLEEQEPDQEDGSLDAH